jgi:hypothetical protein
MEIKGTAVKSINEFVKSKFPSAHTDWIKSLPDASKEIFGSAIYATNWYPVQEGAVEPTLQVARLFYSGDNHKAAWESGRFSADSALSGGIYKFFVKASSPGFIISRANRVFTTYYRPCRMSIADSTAKSVTVLIESEEKVEALVELRIAGWMERALEISGCKGLSITIPESLAMGDRHTKFDIQWE